MQRPGRVAVRNSQRCGRILFSSSTIIEHPAQVERQTEDPGPSRAPDDAERHSHVTPSKQGGLGSGERCAVPVLEVRDSRWTLHTLVTGVTTPGPL